MSSLDLQGKNTRSKYKFGIGYKLEGIPSTLREHAYLITTGNSTISDNGNVTLTVGNAKILL